MPHFLSRVPHGVFGVALATILTAACGASESVPPTKPTVTFPKGFLWGSATAGFQVERDLSHTDWWHWANLPAHIKGGDHPDRGGADALHHIEDDVRALTDSGQNAYRFSIEWGRVYPTRDSFDRDEPDGAAIADYERLMTALSAAHIEPIVTLQHFSFPDWLSNVDKPDEPQGFERPESAALFAEWAARMAKRFGRYVDTWVTINEPLNMALGGYVQGSFPPGRLLAMDRAFKMARGAAEAHARAYDALHANDSVKAWPGSPSSARVSMAFHLRTFHPSDPDYTDDVKAAERVHYIWNEWIVNIVNDGNVDADLDGKLTGPDDVTASPTLAHRLDYLGINYYSDTIIAAHTGLVVPVIDASVRQDNLPTGRPRSDFGWDIYPEGFGTVLRSLKRYKLPVMVLENGIADANDGNRPRFLIEHLYEMGLAMQDGVDVVGYMHWSLLDNFEWATGFCPKFGLYAVDPQTAQRTARPSAKVYAGIIQRGTIGPADLDKTAAYATPKVKCN